MRILKRIIKKHDIGLRAVFTKHLIMMPLLKIYKTLMAQCAAAFERLPVIENVNLLRNIIYSGVWTRFELCRNKRELKTKNESQSENPGKTY